jgi:hypothetical protein
MTALQNIIKEAKSLKKNFPKRFKKWTDYVKQASAIYASKHKGKSPVGKKKVIKKKLVKKKVAKKAIKKRVIKKPSEKVILKKIHTAKGTSKNLYNQLDKLDEAQHSHMSKKMGAVNSNMIDDYKKTCQNIKGLENDLLGFQNILKKYPNAPKNLKDATKKYIKTYKILIKEKKIHAKELKKLL